jgi:hypothetical protein
MAATAKKSPKTAPKPKPQTPADAQPAHFAGLQAEAAAAAAATGEPMAENTPLRKLIRWKGCAVSVPATLDDVPIEVQEAIEQGRLVAHLLGFIGEEQWEQLKKTRRDAGEPVSLGDAQDLINEIGRQAYGQSAGE